MCVVPMAAGKRCVCVCVKGMCVYRVYVYGGVCVTHGGCVNFVCVCVTHGGWVNCMCVCVCVIHGGWVHCVCVPVCRDNGSCFSLSLRFAEHLKHFIYFISRCYPFKEVN